MKALRALRKALRVLLLVAGLSGAAGHAGAQSQEGQPAPARGVSAEEMAKANNPLADANSLNFQDLYTPTIRGVPDETANTLLLRPVVVNGRFIARATVPFVTTPTGAGSYASGLGDVGFFGTYLVTSLASRTQVAIGPQIVLDTATDDALGAGKWQAGAALIAIHPLAGGSLLGTLLTYQTDFAGDENRPDVSLLAFQPLLTLNVGGGLYARSAFAVWTLDFENGRYYVPIGIGIGRVFRAAGMVANVFVEPQLVVYSRGDAQPGSQIAFGLNLQWAKRPEG